MNEQQPKTIAKADLTGIRRGIEKESLRARPNGQLALTPHAAALGSALTHPHITTDFSESQVELITGVHGGHGGHDGVEACLAELTEVHQGVYRVMQSLACGQDDGERLWVGSMPCELPTDETIPLGRYGKSNVGRSKSVYRMGLGQRYGRRMQTISGIHYNWSMPGVTSEQYFALIRNFRRNSFLLLYLFGASPAIGSSFVEGREHRLQRFGDHSLYLPHATSLRMGRLGYQSDAQAALAVSYNCLSSYADSLQEALTRPYAPYEAIGVRNPGGDYNQLSTSLLQIENEFYGTIRPKRVVKAGERPLHALRERGVEYVEVRCMDLDPFVPVGINAQTVRFLDVFLLHCLLTDSPADTAAEIAALGANQHLVAEHGREPGLRLLDAAAPGGSRLMSDWGAELLDQCEPMAAQLDQAQGITAHAEALAAARRTLAEPASTPSARVLSLMASDFDNRYVDFMRQQSEQTRQLILGLPYSEAMAQKFAAQASESVAAQQAIEAADLLPFDAYLQQYMAAEQIRV